MDLRPRPPVVSVAGFFRSGWPAIVFAIGAFLAWSAACGSSGEEAEPGIPLPARSRPDDASSSGDGRPGCGEIDARLLEADTGRAYLLRYFAAGGDTDGSPARSNVVVY